VVAAFDENLGVGLDVQLNDELIAECAARELVSRVQTMRKEAGLVVADRIRLRVQGESELERAVREHKDYVAAETLAPNLQIGELSEDSLITQEWQVNGHFCKIGIARI
jgi:isoleucyl-tRNA synthetase